MDTPGKGTLGIQRPELIPRSRRGRVFAIFAAVLVGCAALAAAAVAGGLWYIDETAREKLTRLADRAGVEIDVDTIVIEPDSHVELLGLRLASGDRDSRFLEIGRVWTDLTFAGLWRGERRPAHVILLDVNADLRRPDELLAAIRRFRASTVGDGEARGKRTLPRVEIARGTAVVVHPLTGEDVEITEASAVLMPERGRWRASAQLRIGSRRIKVDAVIDPEAGHELGATFEPPWEVVLEEGTARFSGLWARSDGQGRLSDVEVVLTGGRGRASASHVSIQAAPADVLGGGAVVAIARGLRGQVGGVRAEAEALRVELAAGEPGDPAGRVRSVTALGANAEDRDAMLAVRAREVRAEVTGIGGPVPLAGLHSVRLSEADATWVLPPPERARNVPFYREIQAFLLGQQRPEETRGGGPAPAPAPRAAEPAGGVAGDAAALLGDARPTLRVIDSSLSLFVPGEREPAAVIDGLSVSLQPGEAGRAATLAARGGLHELATGEKGTFEVTATTSGDGALEQARVQFNGSKLAHKVAGLWDSIRLTEQSSLHVDLLVVPHAQGRGVTATGTVGLAHMGFFAPRIHGSPVDGLELEADVVANVDPESQVLNLDVPRLQIAGKGTFRIAARVERLDGRLPNLDVRIRMPKQDCNALLRSIPPVMIPRLNGLELRGMAEGHFDFTVDLEDPRSYDHDIDVDMRDCKAVRYGEADVEKLKGRFVQEVVEKGHGTGVLVGPGTPHYRRLRKIPRHVRMGALWTEDQRFFQHSGFVPGLIERAVKMNLEGGRYRYGGSSITQQLVKNLFLSREKTLTRKLEEAILVWLVERTITKNRILELYLNCIEYGPAIYGIEAASRAYFGKHVEALSALEGSFLMGLKPYPWAGWEQYERGYVKPWWKTRLGKVLVGMQKRGWITEQELEASRPFEPIFLTSPHAAPPPVPDPVDDGAPPPTPNAPIWLD